MLHVEVNTMESIMAMRTGIRKRINNLEAVNMQIESESRTAFERALREVGLLRYFSHTDIVKPAARWVRFGKPSLIPPRMRQLEADCKRLDELLKLSNEKIASQSSLITSMRLDKQKLKELRTGGWWRRLLFLCCPGGRK